MMKKLIFGLIAILSLGLYTTVEAQSLKGKFSIGRQTGKQVDLFRTEGKFKYKIDSVKVGSDGSFAFKNQKYPKGYYKLALSNENNIIDLILNPSEVIVNLEFSQVRLEKGTKVISSQENKAFWEFKKKDIEVQKTIKALKKQRGQFKAQRNEVKVNEMSNEINKKEKELFEFTQVVINKYPKTFFSKAKVASKSPKQNNKSEYFNDLDFANVNFVRTMVFQDRFQEYIIKHSGHTEVGYYNTVDEIMNRAKANDKVFEFSLYNLLDGFYGSGLEDVATYIMEEYFFGDACGDIEVDELLIQKAEHIKNLQIGNIPPDFTIKNNYDVDVNLQNTCRNNKYTILMFWATHCPHCMRELPGFVNVYNEYKPKGLEIIAVSLDVSKTTWTKTINEKNFNWQNVCQFKNYSSPVCKSYKVNKTPAFFILDTEMRIVAKPKGPTDLRNFLRKNM